MLSYYKTESMIVKMLNAVTEKKESMKPLRVRESFRGRRAFLRASLTVEAALALPLVLFASVALMMPMKVMDAHRRMQSVCEGVCADVCKYAYTLDRLNSGDSVGSDEESFASLAESGTLGVYASLKAAEAVDDSRLTVINCLDTEYRINDDMVTIKLDYRYSLPFSVLGLGSVYQSVVSSRRAWVGANGSDDGGDNAGTGEESDEYVYVGDNSKVSKTYHRSPVCSYLVHIFSGGTVDQAKASGYKPCDRCAREVSSGSVWVTDGGGKYHTDKNCSSMNAYVQTVKLSEIPDYHACHRCGGK